MGWYEGYELFFGGADYVRTRTAFSPAFLATFFLCKKLVTYHLNFLCYKTCKKFVNLCLRSSCNREFLLP
jgi:hypothetical protein